jgi:hypothetical protein
MKIPHRLKMLMGEGALRQLGQEFSDPILMILETVVVEVCKEIRGWEGIVIDLINNFSL